MSLEKIHPKWLWAEVETYNYKYSVCHVEFEELPVCELWGLTLKTHDKKRNPNRSQIIQEKLTEKHYRKDITTKNTQLFRKLLIICSHDILINSTVFEKQKNTVAYVGFTFGKYFRLHAPDRNSSIDSKNLVYILSWNQGNHKMGH